MSNGLGAIEKLWNLDEIKELYEDIEIQKNEEGIEELGFKHLEMAEKFVHTMSKLSSNYIRNKVKFSMQFLADIMKKMFEHKLITVKDLFYLSEQEIIDRIEKCEYDNIANCFDIWRNATKLNESDNIVKNKYCVGVKAKIRYIIPLVRVGKEYIRIDKLSIVAKEDIERCLNYKTGPYGYLDFNFNNEEMT